MMVPEKEGMPESGFTGVVPAAAAQGVSVTRPKGGGRLVRDQGAPAARPWEATGSIDVEALAVWAYKVQQVDRFALQGMHAVEAAAAGFEPGGWSSDGCAALGQIAHLGCRVDRKGASITVSVHPAADALAMVLGTIEHGERVAFWARQGGRPGGWLKPERTFRAVTWVKPWVDAQPVLVRGKPSYCEIIRTGSYATLEHARVQYIDWWEALDRLAWGLSMRALGFVVLRPAAPREPWAEGGEA